MIGNKNYSSWSLRPWILLSEAGIPFTEERVLLDTPATKEKISQYSPAGRVPVLVLDDAVVWDSLAIAETLAERFPQASLWPSDPAARAHARSISAEMHSGFMALRDAMPMNCRAMGRKVALPEPVTNDIDRIFDIWGDCRDRYGEVDGWLFGQFSIADAMFAPVVLRFRTYGINLPDKACHYPARLLQSDAIQNWLQESESEVEVIAEDEKGN
ncbi:MAG: glutathione S-transferase family protein [Woeseia sp.]|nr:glutathione S-transferase family protein [Woeseia sp.]NNL53663.1 glutathione S-transferase family protein [Woeseia sp.]